MGYRYWPYVACVGVGVVLTLLIQVSWRYGNRTEDPPPNGLDLTLREDRTYRVLRVIDGDTLVLENGLHVRYAGVNTPEKGRFISEPAPFSAEAADRNRDLVEGRTVRLQLGTTPLDAYGRVVARVYAVDPAGNETDVEAVLLKEGLARVLGLGLEPGQYQRLKALQEDARAGKRGLWRLANASAEATAAPYCASSSGKLYHRSDCLLARRISPTNRVEFGTLTAAQASGRQPCRPCLGATDTAP